MADLAERTLPLTFDDALHLVRRTTFHPTFQLVGSITGKTPAQAVDILLDMGTAPTPPDWATVAPDPGTPFVDIARRWPEVQTWWMRHVLTMPSLRERLTLFWHNVTTSDYVTVYYGQYIVRQHELLRTHAYGPFATLCENVVGDPAMLIYLNGNQSVKGNPNENFAREFFELFTLGVGNYTEYDIVEAARAFTGWRISGMNGVYNAQLADAGTKTILGETGPWGYRDVVRITLMKPACARFIAGKLYRAYVQSAPDTAVVDAMAQALLDTQYDIRAVLRSVLVSTHFYDASIRGALIKSPAELVIGLAALLNATKVDPAYAVASMARLAQEPFYPPTVEGWKGHHAWITSSTFPQRQRFGENLVAGRKTDGLPLMDNAGQTLAVDVVAFAKQFPDNGDAMKLVASIVGLLLPVPATQPQLDVLLDIMLAGAPVYEWDIDAPGSVVRLRSLLQAIVRMPEFQLM